MIEVVVTTAAIRHAKLSQIVTINNQHPTFYRPDVIPVAQLIYVGALKRMETAQTKTFYSHIQLLEQAYMQGGV